MFEISLDGVFIHRNDNPKLKCFNIAYNLDASAVGSLTFDVPYNHPLMEIITGNKIVRLYQNDVCIFWGEIITQVESFNKTLSVTCWGLLYKLSHSTMPYIGAVTLDVKPLLELFINNYNADVPLKWRIKVGDVTVTDPNESLPRQINYGTVKTNIDDKLVKSLGGYLVIREETDGFYLDYINDFTSINAQGVNFGENLINLLKSRNLETIYTAVRPYGAKLNTDTEERLTIKSVNNDIDFIFNEDVEEYFGRRMTEVFFDDVTIASNLLSKGYEYLANVSKTLDTFELDAVDLSILGIDVKAFSVGDYIPVVSSVHNIDTFTQVLSINFSQYNPKIICGKIQESFVYEQNSTNHVIEEINKNYVTNQTVGEIVDNKTAGVTEDVEASLRPLIEENTSLINQQANQIMLEVSKTYVDNDTLIATQNSILQQTSNELLIKFESLNGDLVNLENQVDDNKTYQETWFRITADGAEMGELNNPYVMRVDNERIAFLANGQIKADMDADFLNIDNANIRKTLQIGNFNFVPRQNGNLSLI